MDTSTLQAHWDSQKNTCSFEEATGSKKYWWKGPCGHSWERTYQKAKQTLTCPYCTGRAVLPGYNDLTTTHPTIAEQWHPHKNDPLTPELVSIGSGRKAWWLCDNGHEWEARIASRKTNGCGVCSGHVFQPGVNDLTTTHPEVADQWDDTKNTLLANQVTAGSHEKTWWRCKLGHSWKTSVIERTRNGSGCPVCLGKRTVSGYNDLSTLAPDLRKEWHPTKNTLGPDQITPGSHQRVWWLCERGHEWETKVEQRYREGTICPKCSLRNVSKAEQEIYNLFQVHKLTPVRNYVLPSGRHIDIFLPESNIGVEYNGLYWHAESPNRSKAYHFEKWKEAKEEGIQLIQIWEDDWLRDKVLVQRMLIHKLDINKASRKYARSLATRVLSSDEARSFLQAYHIQGSAEGSIRLGLASAEGLEAVLVARVEEDQINILRYATKNPVPGGFTKLLSNLDLEGISQIYTFSDNSVSDGALYRRNGFLPVQELPADYMYIYKGTRHHKFGFRKIRFQKDPSLLYQPNLTEKQLAELNGLRRIWDAGKTKWVKTVE